MKRILIIAMAVLFTLVAGCADKRTLDSDSGIDISIIVDSAAPKESYEPDMEIIDDPGPGLMNYREWMSYTSGKTVILDLDTLMVSRVYEDGYADEAILYPSVWPSGILRDSIPEYNGIGYLQQLYVVHPNMSYRSGDVKFLVVTIYQCEETDVYDYIENLDGFIQDERAERELVKSFPTDEETLKAFKYFANDECSLIVIYAEDGIGDHLQLYVNYSREPYVLDTENIGRTKLQNVEEWAKDNPDKARHTIELDHHDKPAVDDVGRQVDVYHHPSKWPKDVFGDLIPVYEGEGVMVELAISTPHEDPSADKALIVSLFIEEFKYEDINTYVKTLIDFGYIEMAPEDYNEQDAGQGIERNVYHVLNLPGHRCFVGTVYEADVEQLQISLRFEGRYKNFFEAQGIYNYY